jgi:hypothetical protein
MCFGKAHEAVIPDSAVVGSYDVDVVHTDVCNQYQVLVTSDVASKPAAATRRCTPPHPRPRVCML